MSNFSDFKPIYNTRDLPNHITQDFIISHYYGDTINFNKLFRCPFHKDSTPSLGFKIKNDNVLFKCFGCNKSGNYIDFVSNLFQIDSKDAINKIVTDFKPIQLSKIPKRENVYDTSLVEIYPSFRDWDINDYKYWNKFNITFEVLLKYNVFPCKSVYMKTRFGEYRHYADNTPNNPIYCIKINNRYKIYRPLNQKGRGKWLSNTTIYDIYGLDYLDKTIKLDYLIVTSSSKDVITLSLMGYKAISFISELRTVPNSLLDILKEYTNKLLVMYDNDEIGLSNAISFKENHNEYFNNNIELLLMDKSYPKDISDMVSKLGFDHSKNILDSLILSI